jgi:hypothetical protein
MKEAMMKDSASVLEADLRYAERMVRTGFITPEQAAQTCGVLLAELQARLSGQYSASAVSTPMRANSLNTWVPV